MIRVVLADDHEVVRAGFRLVLENSNQVEVVGEAADGTQAYAVTVKEKPDVLLLDISMPPGKNGLAACEKIAHDVPKAKILITTMYAEAEYLFRALQNGASGYLLKNATPAEMVTAVRTVANGDIYIHPKMAEIIAQGAPEDLASSQQLSSRELEIVELLAKGYTNREIAELLFISVKTVEAHRAKIYSKMNFSSRAELVKFAVKHKMFDI